MLTGHVKVVLIRTKCLVGSIERKLHVFTHIYILIVWKPWHLTLEVPGLWTQAWQG